MGQQEGPMPCARLFCLALASAAVAACSGSIGASSSVDNPPSDRKPPASPPATPSPDTPLWRLTRTEYKNTLRDLLGVDVSLATNRLDADKAFNGLDMNSE